MENEHHFVSKGKEIQKGSFLYNQLFSLREIVTPTTRLPYIFAVSPGVYKEIEVKQDKKLNCWFEDLWQYWQANNHENVSSENASLFEHDHSIKGALSSADLKIFGDAITLQCDAILTCDKFRDRQEWLYNRYKIMVLYPTDLLEFIDDFRPLWC